MITTYFRPNIFQSDTLHDNLYTANIAVGVKWTNGKVSFRFVRLELATRLEETDVQSTSINLNVIWDVTIVITRSIYLYHGKQIVCYIFFSTKRTTHPT